MPKSAIEEQIVALALRVDTYVRAHEETHERLAEALKLARAGVENFDDKNQKRSEAIIGEIAVVSTALADLKTKWNRTIGIGIGIYVGWSFLTGTGPVSLEVFLKHAFN
jgi:hypothetical protein